MRYLKTYEATAKFRRKQETINQVKQCVADAMQTFVDDGFVQVDSISMSIGWDFGLMWKRRVSDEDDFNITRKTLINISGGMDDKKSALRLASDREVVYTKKEYDPKFEDLVSEFENAISIIYGMNKDILDDFMFRFDHTFDFFEVIICSDIKEDSVNESEEDMFRKMKAEFDFERKDRKSKIQKIQQVEILIKDAFLSIEDEGFHEEKGHELPLGNNDITKVYTRVNPGGTNMLDMDGIYNQFGDLIYYNEVCHNRKMYDPTIKELENALGIISGMSSQRIKFSFTNYYDVDKIVINIKLGS